MREKRLEEKSLVAGGRSIVAGARSRIAGRRSIVAGGRSIFAGGRSMVAGGESMVAGGRSIVAGARSRIAGVRSMVAGMGYFDKLSMTTIVLRKKHHRSSTRPRKLCMTMVSRVQIRLAIGQFDRILMDER